MQRQSGLRAVAVYEAAKGILVLAVGLGLLRLIHHDVQQIAEHIVKHLHLNPAAHFPRVFLAVASKVDDARLWALAAGAAAYSGLRLLEAAGLWKGRRWLNGWARSAEESTFRWRSTKPRRRPRQRDWCC